MTRTITVAEIAVSGAIQSTYHQPPNEKGGGRTYVRFAGAQGQVSVTVPEGIPGYTQLKDGAEITCLCDARAAKEGAMYLTAYEVRPLNGASVKAAS